MAKKTSTSSEPIRRDLALAELQRDLRYDFRDSRHLTQALTHRSFANERPRQAPADNERLEFLGDAILSMVISSLLYDRFPEATEGELTRRRADLVCEAGLAALASEIQLGPLLRLGKGEQRSGGRQKPRLLASTFEALIGAIFVDADVQVATEVLNHLFRNRLEVKLPGAADFKSRVQELVQGLGRGTPRYELLSTDGPDHERIFHIALVLEGQTVASGTGRSKSEAEQQAAERAYFSLTDASGISSVEEP
ncbi:MAG: ribonuclease III [Myxococcota bacterium]